MKVLKVSVTNIMWQFKKNAYDIKNKVYKIV